MLNFNINNCINTYQSSHSVCLQESSERVKDNCYFMLDIIQVHENINSNIQIKMTQICINFLNEIH
jgi:hypothetical protein